MNDSNARFLGPAKDLNAIKTGKDCKIRAYEHGIQIEIEDGKRVKIVFDAERALRLAQDLVRNFGGNYEGFRYRITSELERLIVSVASEEIAGEVDSAKTS